MAGTLQGSYKIQISFFSHLLQLFRCIHYYLLSSTSVSLPDLPAFVCTLQRPLNVTVISLNAEEPLERDVVSMGSTYYTMMPLRCLVAACVSASHFESVLFELFLKLRTFTNKGH